jgi:hypothetical protein
MGEVIRIVFLAIFVLPPTSAGYFQHSPGATSISMQLQEGHFSSRAAPSFNNVRPLLKVLALSFNNGLISRNPTPSAQ